MATGRTRWWNSTGGGSWTESGKGVQKSNIKAGDGGAKFRSEWPELDRENWKWMKENRIDPSTGNFMDAASGGVSHACAPGMALRRPSGSQPIAGAVVEGGRAVGEEGRGWLRRNKLLVAGMVIFTYVLIARLLGEGTNGGAS